jgi:peptidylprolyl isomerase
MVKNSVAKKDVKKAVKAAKVDKKIEAKAAPQKGATPDKKVEKILESGLDSKVEYAYEDDSKDSKSKKSDAPKGAKSAKSEKIAIDKPKPKIAGNGHLVSVDYVGTLKSGEEFDNSKNHGPIQFIVGGGQVIPGFDKAVRGMKIGDKKKFTMPKTEAYGDVNPQLVQVVPLDKIPEHIRSQLKVGGFLVMQSPVGQQVPVKVIKLDKTSVSLDMNHPLAGQDLTFNIKLVDLNNAPEHGECGCGDDCSDECGSDESCGGSCDCGHNHK